VLSQTLSSCSQRGTIPSYITPNQHSLSTPGEALPRTKHLVSRRLARDEAAPLAWLDISSGPPTSAGMDGDSHLETTRNFPGPRPRPNSHRLRSFSKVGSSQRLEREKRGVARTRVSTRPSEGDDEVVGWRFLKSHNDVTMSFPPPAA